MVKVDISQILESIGAIQPYSVVVTAQEIGESECWVQGEIAVSGQIANVGSGFRLTGNVTGRAAFECSRCLKAFEQPVNFQFDEDLDSTVFAYPAEGINIAEPIRAALIFNEPMKPVCSEECQGLCPHCGADRNQTDCGCDKEQLDPRLAALGRLLEK